ADRLARAGRACRAAGIEALLVTPSADLLYLVGYDAPVLERLTALLVRAKGPPVLVVPELEVPRAAASPAGKLVEFEPWPDGEDPNRVVAKVLPGSGTFG